VPDAEVKAEPLSRYANRPYAVFGKRYTPIEGQAPFVQRGVATWYGKKFHGQRTASGELYDMYKMTAAHPTLPIPSFARIVRPGHRQAGGGADQRPRPVPFGPDRRRVVHRGAETRPARQGQPYG
jgi:hypothetical protein